MTSAENNVSEPPNLKISWGRISPDPPTRFVASALAKMPPLQKNLAMALLSLLSSRQVTFSKATTSLAANGFTSDLLNVTVTVVVTVNQISILISNLLFNSIFNEHSSFSFLDFRFFFCKFYVIS